MTYINNHKQWWWRGTKSGMKLDGQL